MREIDWCCESRVCFLKRKMNLFFTWLSKNWIKKKEKSKIMREYKLMLLWYWNLPRIFFDKLENYHKQMLHVWAKALLVSFHKRNLPKGQEISEWKYEVVALPKIWSKKFEKFCPEYLRQNFSNLFVHIFGNATTSYFHYEISWPLLCNFIITLCWLTLVKMMHSD